MSLCNGRRHGALIARMGSCSRNQKQWTGQCPFFLLYALSLHWAGWRSSEMGRSGTRSEWEWWTERAGSKRGPVHGQGIHWERWLTQQVGSSSVSNTRESGKGLGGRRDDPGQQQRKAQWTLSSGSLGTTWTGYLQAKGNLELWLMWYCFSATHQITVWTLTVGSHS